jgi:hypothetical protein
MKTTNVDIKLRRAGFVATKPARYKSRAAFLAERVKVQGSLSCSRSPQRRYQGHDVFGRVSTNDLISHGTLMHKQADRLLRNSALLCIILLSVGDWR